MGFQSAGIGRLCSWDRSSAGGLAVLFAGVGFFCGTAGAMANEIGIPFAGVQVLCGGASGVASEVWVQSAGVGPTFCVTGCTANISGVLFGFCVLFIMSIVIDYVINSSRQSVQFLIFSRKHDEIAEGITKQIDRGVTLLDGTGWYSKQGIKVVVVLAKKSQSLDIFRLVKDIDPNAFISQSNVVGVYGEGFDKLKIK